MSQSMAMSWGLGVGMLVGRRYRIDAVVGKGGMSTVYRAVDATDGNTVALKVLHTDSCSAPLGDVERFMREARMLAELHDPGIVAYVGHGLTDEGLPYLAMEWLDGEDLAQHLTRQRLDIAESMVLLRKVAEALGAAHRRGIVHRDLKPANVFLRNGDVLRPVLLDFGIARWADWTLQMTRPGSLVGTPGYMAPEQARGQGDVGAAADIFSLGCVVFECLSGRPPFVANHVVAILSKILFAEVPLLSTAREDVPRPIERLVARMLAKDARDRPANADELLEEIRRVEVELGEVTTLRTASPSLYPGLTRAEQLLFSVVISGTGAALPKGADEGVFAATVRRQTSRENEELRATLSTLGAKVEWLADGTIVAAVVQAGSATDQAAQAARCALLMRKRLPKTELVLATGRGMLEDTNRIPAGEVIDRAAEMLRELSALDLEDAGDAAEGIWLDETTAGLLRAHFELIRVAGHPVLKRELVDFSDDKSERLLLGRSIPCLGREQELLLLESIMLGHLEESTPGAVLLVGPSGVGKSRLLHEFLRRFQKTQPDAELFYGRGDPMSAASPYGLLSQVLRRLCGIQAGEPAEAQRDELRQRLGRHLPPAIADEVIAALTELSMHANGAELARAMAEPVDQTTRVSREQRGRLEQAFLDFLRAESKAHPVLLVLEDLQWADELTVHMIDVSLRALYEEPLFVVACGRPEVEKIFTRLWSDRVQEIRLGGLGRRASEELVRKALGERTLPATIRRLVDQAAGNVLYLEELIRAEAEGKGDSPPETVLAMLQARIQRMPPGARRVLRAASIFGQTFWRRGVLHLLGIEQEAADDTVDRWLEFLLVAEVIEHHRESRFSGDDEYGFRHALMRDAAYGLLTDEDRKLGHGLVGLYLEQAGEPDPAVLAGHTYKIVQYLEHKHASFFVSRLILLTGIPLRRFTSVTPDDPATLRKIRKALSTLLRQEEIEEMRGLFKDS